jgi:hypothetical protein
LVTFEPILRQSKSFWQTSIDVTLKKMAIYGRCASRQHEKMTDAVLVLLSTQNPSQAVPDESRAVGLRPLDSVQYFIYLEL